MNQTNKGEGQTAPEKESMGQILWQLTRPHTLTASFVPVPLGTVLAMFYVKVDLVAVSGYAVFLLMDPNCDELI